MNIPGNVIYNQWIDETREAGGVASGYGDFETIECAQSLCLDVSIGIEQPNNIDLRYLGIRYVSALLISKTKQPFGTVDEIFSLYPNIAHAFAIEKERNSGIIYKILKEASNMPNEWLEPVLESVGVFPWTIALSPRGKGVPAGGISIE